MKLENINLIKYVNIKKNNKDVVLVNMSFLQNEKYLAQFLDFLSYKYMPNLKHNYKCYILSLPHTKNNSKIKNRNYNINVDKFRDIINSGKNEEIEKFIKNLTFI